MRPSRRIALARASILKSLTAASIGSFGEIYDFAVFGFSVPIVAKHFFPSSDPAAGILSTFAVYAVAFFARPLGGLLFGYLADRIARVKVMAITIWLMAGGTAMMGALPTYAGVGILAPLFLVACRIAQGLAIGGETTGSTAYLLESAPDGYRGLWVGIMWFFARIPNAGVALMLAALQATAGPATYSEWLWRIPFIFGALIGIIGFWLRRSLDDPKEFKDTIRQHPDNPPRQVTRSGILPILHVFMIQPLQTVGSYLLLGFMYTFLVTQVRLDPNQALVANAIAILALSAMIPLGGWLSHFLGRKPVLSLSAVWIGLAAYPAVSLASKGSLSGALSRQLLVATGVRLYGGAAFTAAAEFFPTSFRATGHAIAYQLAVAIFGGSTPFVATWLVTTYGSPMLPSIYVAVAALAILFEIQFLPETKGISLRKSDLAPERLLHSESQKQP
jgi:MHS family proline/betaine transporter-like MFS transporter